MAQSKETIKNQIINFYNDALFQKLNAYYGKTTLFNILKIERNENRHSAFLAWLLDVKGSHGMGEEPLKKFMRLLAWAEKDPKYDNPFLVGNYSVENMKVETETPVKANGHSKTGRIDIYIRFDYKIESVLGEGKNKLYHAHVILENKVYTNEHDDQTKLYYDWAKQEYKGKHDQTIIGVFLAPEVPKKCSGDTSDFSYIKVTYEDVLVHVIEPLLMLEMPDEARMMISDYVINLGQPLQAKDEDGKKTTANEDTILAVSKENEGNFIKIYEENKDLLDAALYSDSFSRSEKQLKIVYADFEKFKAYTATDLDLLKRFWESNKNLLRMILNAALKKIDDTDDYQNAVNILLRLSSSNRDNTKYLVYAKDGVLMNEGNKPAPKSLASFYIFKAWVHDHQEASLSDIRAAFSVAECAKHYLETFQYLFYRKADFDYALEHNKTERTYYIAPLDEDDETTRKAKKYLTWDFFTDDKHYLEIQNEKVLSVKMWLKDEFDKLVKHARDKGIVVEEKSK